MLLQYDPLRNRFQALVLPAVVLVAVGCASPPPEQMPEAVPGATGIDTARLEEALDEASRIHTIKSLLVWRDGRMVAERYFNGTTPDELHDVRSVTKSVLSALVGIAIEEGHIGDVEETLGEYLNPVIPDLEPEWGAVRLRHLLTMTAGHDWDSGGSPPEVVFWFRSEDQVEYILEKAVEDPPGSRFRYSDGSAHLMSVVLTEATGEGASDYARRVLFESLGIGPHSWLEDSRGYNYGGVGLQLTARDMVKLGLLYLQRGTYAGVQVVPEDWVEASTGTQVVTRDASPLGPEYGYYWWIGRAREHDLFFASGHGGQFIFVVPELHLVIVATSDWRRAGFFAKSQWVEVLQVIAGSVLPAVLPVP